VTAYYVVSEALTNVAKHARRLLRRGDLDERNGDLELQISDDGRRRRRPLARLGPAGPEGSHRGERWQLDRRESPATARGSPSSCRSRLRALHLERLS
jgi:hypothetical protein